MRKDDMKELKGSVSHDFRPPFFHDSNPSRPLMNRLKYSRIRFRFRRDIQSQSLKNLTPRGAAHCGVKISWPVQDQHHAY